MDNKIPVVELFHKCLYCLELVHKAVHFDVGSYMQYIFPLLFFKRICDIYDEELAVSIKEYGENFTGNHRFVIPVGSHWKDVREITENVGVAIENAFRAIERANVEKLTGVFGYNNWTNKGYLPDELLKNFIAHFSIQTLSLSNYPDEEFGQGFEYLIRKFADISKKNAGEFYTPRTIVKLLIMLLAPKAGETVYDPAVGTGGMLIEAIRYMRDDRQTYGRIYGQEKNLANAAIARMNLFLHGARDFKITQGDTLRSPSFIYRGQLQTFDCVVANPPFSLKDWGAEQFSSDVYGRNIWGNPTNRNADFAWLQHMVKSMDAKKGRLAVILLHGILSRGGKDGDIRKQMIESDKLEYIIVLPAGIFYSTGVSACVLVLNNNKPVAHLNKVCLVDATQIYTAQRTQNIMTEDDVNTVYNLCSNYTDVTEKAKVVTLDDLRGKEYTLLVSAYIQKTATRTVNYGRYATNE